MRALAERWQREREEAGGDVRPGELARLQVFQKWAEALQAGRLPDVVEAEVMVIALGDISILLMPGEMFVEFGLAIKEHARPRHVMTLAHANGNPGYIPHRSAYPEGGYEVDEAYCYYGYPSCFAPEAGEVLVKTAIQLLADVAE